MDTKSSDGKTTACDALTGEEISSTTIPPSTPKKAEDTPQQHNAFTELLSPSKNKKSTPSHDPNSSKPKAPTTSRTFTGRSGLGAYTHSPEFFPTSRVISYSDDFVTINDLYPKSSIHLLLLPRNPSKQMLHPLEALQDATFLSYVQSEVHKLKTLVAKELQRRYGKFSAQDQEREKAVEKVMDQALETGTEIDESTLPPGRDWSKDVIAGVHAHPSMSHLHVHVLSVDRYSECLRHRKHYNSFATPFLVDVEEFPLTEEEMRRRRKERFLERELVCWRCGRGFGNKFGRLKEHLGEEFEAWKRV